MAPSCCPTSRLSQTATGDSTHRLISTTRWPCSSTAVMLLLAASPLNGVRGLLVGLKHQLLVSFCMSCL